MWHNTWSDRDLTFNLLILRQWSLFYDTNLAGSLKESYVC